MTYDNTDERGEDAVARQRGESERPQHVDTCRVYNCYGCEEIVDEPGHLPECEPDTTADGALIACICDRLRGCEARVEDTEALTNHILQYQKGYADALDAATEAVAACKTHVRRRNVARHSDWFAGRTNWYAIKFTTVDRDDALAAIAALKEEK